MKTYSFPVPLNASCETCSDMPGQLARLQRLREHHQRCQQRSDMEAKARMDIERERTRQLIQMMNRKKEELRTCVTDDSLSDSSHKLVIDYVSSSSYSSEAEEVNSEPKKEEIDVLTQRATSPGPSDDLKRTKKTGNAKGKRPKRALRPAQDSDEADVSSSGCSDDPKTTKMKAMEQQPPNQNAINRRPWSPGEKEAVWRQLGRLITLHRIPRKDACNKALQAEPILRRRSWKDLKNQAKNYIRAQKRKL